MTARLQKSNPSVSRLTLAIRDNRRMRKHALYARTVFLLALVSLARPAMGADPLPAKATVSAGDPVYQSPFANYKRYADQAVESWTAANDRVGLIGGWQAYAREAQAATQQAPSAPQSAPQPSPKPAAAAGPTPSDHSTHH